ncbi:MAG TPA: ExeM/NucH family extracellular endonuclease, partial [Thermoanaerobaculia bacterium]|nr:ExeM/NucH family extracellular endonuclease [Thermoanaerobaculia bacterium]
NDTRLSGFFLQEESSDSDLNPATSEGIFIFCNTCPTDVAEGQKVQVTGTVSEFNNLTEITATSAGSVVITNAGNNLALLSPPVAIDLPIAAPSIDDFYEPMESMVVTFVDTLTVSEYFEQAQYGRIELFEGGRPRQYAEANPPSAAGYAAQLDNLNRRRVYLDDDDNAQNSVLNLPNGQQFVFHPRANGGLSVGTQGVDFFRGGDLVNGLTGILHFSFSGGTSPNEWRVRPIAASPATFTVANPRPATAPAVGGAIKVASANMLNYFTTLDVRGADSNAELIRQRERASIVLCGLNPHVAALMEVENSPTHVAINDLLNAVNARCGGVDPYAFVNTGGSLGTDQIRVIIIYRTATLSPVGSPIVDLDPAHNRPPTAQTFDVVAPANPAFGKRFTVIANHGKAKSCSGASGGDLDQNDGQACFAATRLAQANRLLTWINATVIPAAGDPDVVMLGDFNSYAKETSTTTLTSGGYTDLESALLGPAAYSYLFDGQLGHIDYAFTSASLTPQVTGVSPWHINADENPLFDYN